MNDPTVRRPDGTFVPGSQHPHNPKIKDLNKVRKKLQEAVWRAAKPEDVAFLLKEVYDIAKDAGNLPHVRIAAAREFFDRVLGKPAQQIELTARSKHTTNIAIIAAMTRELFQLPDPSGEAQAKAIDAEVLDAPALPDHTGEGAGAGQPVPAVPEEVDRGPQPTEDRGEG